MELKQAVTKLEQSKNIFSDTRKYIRSLIANQLIAGVQLRIEQSGLNANLVKFSPYSHNPTLLGYSDYRLNKRAFNILKKQKKKSLKKARRVLSLDTFSSIDTGWVTVNGHSLIVVDGGYEEIRRVAGYQTGHKDFNVTGAMWRSIKVKKTTTNGGVITVTYGPTDIKTTRMVEGHSLREGINILLPDKNQILDLQQDIQTYFEEALKNILNG